MKTTTVTIDRELHRKAKIAAVKLDIKLSEFYNQAIREKLKKEKKNG